MDGYHSARPHHFDLRLPGLGFAAGIAAGLGVAAALATIAAGFMDWMDVNPPEKAVGMSHATLNTIATVMFAISFLMRFRGHWQLTRGAFIVSLAGYLLVIAGAYLGGTMVFRIGAMINRNAYRSGPEGFQAAMAVADLPEGQPKRVDIDGQPILLLRSGEEIHAIGAVCSHYGAPLEEGKQEGDTIRCPWHSSRFALVDGSVREGPACAPLPAYEVRIVRGQVHVKRRQ